MSVPKGRRSDSNIIYFTHAYYIVENVTKFLLRDFGIKRTYRDLKVFTSRAKMDLPDMIEFNNIAEKYKLEVETSYPEFLLNHYRDKILNDMDNLIFLITSAHTMYPNSMYEFNIKRQYISDAISCCFKIKHSLQLAIKLFQANNLEAYVPYVVDIDKEIEYLKSWRKDCNKVKKTCIDNDTKLRNASDHRVLKKEFEELKSNENSFIKTILGINSIEAKLLLDNLNNANYYIDQHGKIASNMLVPAIIMYSDKECTDVVSLCLD